MSSALSGKASTVLGAIEAEAMGVTLPHEHLLIDFAVMFKEPAAASEKGLAYQEERVGEAVSLFGKSGVGPVAAGAAVGRAGRASGAGRRKKRDNG